MTTTTAKTIVCALFCLIFAFTTGCASTSGSYVVGPMGASEASAPAEDPAPLPEVRGAELVPNDVTDAGSRCFSDPACDPAYPR
jgi:hypothetical protein